MKKIIRKTKLFIKKHKLSAVIVLIAFFAALGIIANDFIKNPSFNAEFKTPKKKETRVAAPLTGELVDPVVSKSRPIAVVIENSPDARPQTGYNDADIVYETLAEGGVTRTLLIFHSKKAVEIGPVRSARPYFLDWSSEYDALFAHVGGSVEAFDYIRRYAVNSLNQFNYGSYYWRSQARIAPHNVYTTSENLYKAAAQANFATTKENLSWHKFKKDIAIGERSPSQEVAINYSYPTYRATFTYVPENNNYLRSIAGVPAKDNKSGERISVKNLIVLYHSITPGRTRAGEQKVDIGTIAKGSGLLFQDGKAVKVSWEKSSRTARTIIKNENGEEIALNPGRTWISIPPINANVNY